MQVGFNPISIKSPAMNKPQNSHSVNFGQKIDVKFSAKCVDHFASKIERGIHEDSKENRELLKQVIVRIKERYSPKWDIPDVKEAVYKAWGKDDELKEVFKGY